LVLCQELNWAAGWLRVLSYQCAACTVESMACSAGRQRRFRFGPCGCETDARTFRQPNAVASFEIRNSFPTINRSM